MYFYDEEAATFGENAYSLYQAVQTYEFHTATKGKSQGMKKDKVVTDPDRAQPLTLRAGELLLASV
jgi:hypothetical protein